MYRPNIKVTLHSITKGECSDGFKVGDTWLIEGTKTPDGLCEAAYNTMYPVIRVLRYGGDYSGEYATGNPTDTDKGVKYVCCPDSKHMVVFEVRRMP
ncbi:TIGR04076 family protein [Chloroflexota bacterium]